MLLSKSKHTQFGRSITGSVPGSRTRRKICPPYNNRGYTISTMYLYSCFKFVKSCIVPCNAVNSDCILQELSQVKVSLQVPLLAGDAMNLKLFFMHSFSFASCMIQFSRFFVAIAWVYCKQTTHIQLN